MSVTGTPPRDDVRRRLSDALREGRPDAVADTLEPIAVDDRIAFRKGVRDAADGILGAAGGSRDPSRRWRGVLRSGHYAAAQVALLGTSSLSRATQIGALDTNVAADYIPRLFPDDLDAFVEAYALRFLTNPKAWDRNRGIEAIFDWAQRGIIAPPLQQGAALMLICWAPGPSLWSYLQQHPVTIHTTLPQIFHVPGIKGASAAQRDAARPGSRLDGYVIPRLIREHSWNRDDVLRWCETALLVPRSAYEQRWFQALRQRVDSLPGARPH
ncbi:hypothetical protein [Microbacterium sp.]|uniref:hypothetical protein n=1 Tax=Microbacterium sp. TaxID=51671 RepID=UPI0028110680|nr:hypothetical protein [Microbacterium sp.]